MLIGSAASMYAPFWRRLHCIWQPAMLQALRALADRPQGLQPGADRHILHCRARLTAMNELDREMELAERAERRDDLMQRRQLLQKQRQAERRQREPARKVNLGACGACPRAAIMNEAWRSS